MTLHYDDIKDIDWKFLKKEWDDNPGLFEFSFYHNGRRVSFSSGIDSRKTLKLCVYIDGVFNGSYTNDKHEYRVYMNKKSTRISAKQKAFDAKMKKAFKRLGRTYNEMKVITYNSPIFGNIAQIKKMVDAL